MARDVDHDPLVGADHAVGGESLERGHGDATGGLGEDALGTGEQLHPVDDLVVGHCREAATGLAHRVEREVAVGRVAALLRIGLNGPLNHLDKAYPTNDNFDPVSETRQTISLRALRTRKA